MLTAVLLFAAGKALFYISQLAFLGRMKEQAERGKHADIVCFSRHTAHGLHLATGARVFWETADALGHRLEKEGKRKKERKRFNAFAEPAACFLIFHILMFFACVAFQSASCSIHD